MKPVDILTMNKTSWEQSAERFFGRTALPEFGPNAPSEDDLHLFGDVNGKTVLDIGCGSGHSLAYMGNQGAGELWGLDLTTKQIEAATGVLSEQNATVKLFESPMEENPGLPMNHFDVVYSIYALGWTYDLKKTLSHVHSYLKPGGTFIFSWENPMHDRIQYRDGEFVMTKSYVTEGPEYNEGWNKSVVIHHRKLTTYINTLIQCGFTIENVIDDVVIADIPSDNPERWYASQKAEWVPSTFIVKARKM
ncbi:class I SAM-dependent methyltransferase [Rossellomorea marisflavi]|uniref:class I SAM-dependent methyltransferase n=1 Tax=Rossellomorea marisflavi TaxID=189381 RepID=UPI003511B6D4